LHAFLTSALDEVEGSALRPGTRRNYGYKKSVLLVESRSKEY